MAFSLRYKLGKGITSTQPPPIALTKSWSHSYNPTATRPKIDLSQGIPGIPPPQHVLEAISDAYRVPKYCGYSPMNGVLEMRKAVIDEIKSVYGCEDVDVDDVSMTAGCNMSFMAVIMTLAEAGDQVILPVPWYFNHQMTLQMLNIKTVPLLCNVSNGFLPSPDECEKLITERTKAIVLVSPNNPTGAIYPNALLFRFARLAQKHNISLIIDETYRDFIIEKPPHSLFSEKEKGWDWRSTFIHLFSFSKSYCIPGHRLGVIVASPLVLKHVNTVLDCMQICAPTALQHSLHPLLPALRSFISTNSHSLVRRQTLFRSILPPGWEIGSQGAYYAFVRHPIKGVSAFQVSKRLAEEFGVVSVPGGCFGLGYPEEKNVRLNVEDDRWIRFSVANVDDEHIALLTERLIACQESFEKEEDVHTTRN